MTVVEDGALVEREVPMLSALNLDLRDEYVADCANGVRRWNQALEDAGLEQRLVLPHEGFNRKRRRLRPAPRSASPARCWARRTGRRGSPTGCPRPPTARQVAALMVPDYEDGEFAGWIAPPAGRGSTRAGRVRLRAPRRRGPGVTLAWVREDTPVWDADKQRVIGGAPEGAFELSFAEGDPLPGEWWAARDGAEDGPVVGYGRLDIDWGGDAEILLAVDPARQEEGIGTFVLGALEGEALRHGINYVYNVIPEHSERAVVHDWFVVRGFRGPIDGHLRKRVATRPQPSRRPATTDAAYDPGAEGDRGPGDEESGGYVDVEEHRY